MNYSIDKVDIDKIDLCIPPNKILGPAVEAEKLGLEIEMIYRSDTPPLPAPPSHTVHIMQSCTKCPRWKITLKYILEKYCYKWT